MPNEISLGVILFIFLGQHLPGETILFELPLYHILQSEVKNIEEMTLDYL